MLFGKKTFIVLLFVLAGFACFFGCLNNTNEQKDARGSAYAGSETCNTCHKIEYNSYLHTAHHHASMPANDSTIYGAFTPPNNEFIFAGDRKVVMQKTDSGFYQTSYYHGERKESHRFDIVVGSGRKAQTYLYHDGDEIHQLPMSYFVTAKTWANSPGFPVNEISFSRNIPSGCFGCHASTANVAYRKTGSLQITEKYIEGQQILGIDCERCHGPGKQHVSYQTSHPNDTIAHYITPVNKLTRIQQMDMCGVCHSGRKTAQKPLFTFMPGDELDEYYYADVIIPSADKRDVHGSQVPLLKASKCYRMSSSLTCMSCHNPHVNEKDSIKLFSQRCMNCHSEANHNFCKMTGRSVANIKSNCIDCHMPARVSKLITLLTNGKQAPIPDMIRTHLIAVYKNETDKVMKYLEKN